MSLQADIGALLVFNGESTDRALAGWRTMSSKQAAWNRQYHRNDLIEYYGFWTAVICGAEAETARAAVRSVLDEEQDTAQAG